MRTKERSIDYGFLAVVATLLVLGVLAVFDASFVRAMQSRASHHDTWFYVKRQVGFGLVGLAVMYMMTRMPLELFKRFAKTFLWISCVLLLLVLVPGVGKLANGARRWIQVGPFAFQPSEIAKIALVMYLASVLSELKGRVRYLKPGILKNLIPVAVIAGLLMKEPDMGTMLVVVGAALTMLFIAGARPGHLFGVVVAGVLLVTLLAIVEPYRMARLATFLNPSKDYYGSGYQITHSLIALGTGGWSGLGLCEGREKMYIPEPHTDMIYSTIGEEAGLIGSLLVLGLFAFLTYRGICIALRAKSAYSGLLAGGLTAVIGLQALVNIAVVTCSIPATGVPLPFISYGGSSLLFMLMAVGIILSVSRQTDLKLKEDNDENSSNGGRDGRAHLPRTQRRRGTSTRDTRYRTAVYR